MHTYNSYGFSVNFDPCLGGRVWWALIGVHSRGASETPRSLSMDTSMESIGEQPKVTTAQATVIIKSFSVRPQVDVETP